MTALTACCLLLAAPVATADVDWYGFVEAGYGLRTTENALFEEGKDYTQQEARAQLKLSSYGERGEVFLRVDFLHDQVAGGGTDLDLREAFLRFSALGEHVEVKAGRQALTWGTGDLVFINDLFPKDWVSFFIGREDQYLKAPVDALRFGIFGKPFDVDIVLSPRFTADRIPTGERLSFFVPRGVSGGPLEPADTFGNGEVAARLSRYVGSIGLAFYGYKGFFKTPRGLAWPCDLCVGYLRPYYPRLWVYGASARGSGLGGIFWVEGGFYDSREDRGGEDPLVPNSSLRYLGGFERQVRVDFNLGVQYYGEWMMDHDKYAAGLPPGARQEDELRQMLTLRVEKLLHYQTIRLSLFTFYSPTDEDAYAKGMASYKVYDDVEVAAGVNLFVGKNVATQFGQSDENDNVYVRFRYDF